MRLVLWGRKISLAFLMYHYHVGIYKFRFNLFGWYIQKEERKKRKSKRVRSLNLYDGSVLHFGNIVLDGRLFQMKTVLSNNSSRTIDESKNNLGSSFSLMTIKASVIYLLHILMMKCNGWSNGNK